MTRNPRILPPPDSKAPALAPPTAGLPRRCPLRLTWFVRNPPGLSSRPGSVVTTGEAGRLLADAGRRCQDSGADVVLICSNLMHKVADDVAAAIDVPLLRITDAIAAARAKARGWSRLGVLGAHWVIEEDFYLGRLQDAGLGIEVPGPEDRRLVDRVVFEELTQGTFDDASRAEYHWIIADLAAAGAQAVALSCTEIEQPLGPDDSPLPMLDSMRAHAEAAVDLALAGAATSGGCRG